MHYINAKPGPYDAPILNYIKFSSIKDLIDALLSETRRGYFYDVNKDIFDEDTLFKLFGDESAPYSTRDGGELPAFVVSEELLRWEDILHIAQEITGQKIPRS